MLLIAGILNCMSSGLGWHATYAGTIRVASAAFYACFMQSKRDELYICDVASPDQRARTCIHCIRLSACL